MHWLRDIPVFEKVLHKVLGRESRILVCHFCTFHLRTMCAISQYHILVRVVQVIYAHNGIVGFMKMATLFIVPDEHFVPDKILTVIKNIVIL